MGMTTFSFLLYFLPAMVIGHAALFFSGWAQNLWLVCCSAAFFFINGEITLLLLLLVLLLLNYFLGYAARKNREKGSGVKAVVVLACVINLLPLFLFDYLVPAIDSLAELIGFSVPGFPLAPLGLSFLALQGISYVVDISRGTAPWDGSIVGSALYLSFFAPLTAGPIIRYHDVAAQISARKVRFEDFAEGLCRFIVGLGKVVLIAQPTVSITNIIFDRSNMSGIYTSVPVSLALLGLLTCLLSIYYYYAGYSDLVLGLGKMLGFTLPENFDRPHLARSAISFWRRFYISLTAWFEEYVYQPLDKKRSNNDKMVFHTVVMWLLIALWLGLGLPNIILAIWSTLFIIIERIIDLDENKNPLLRHIVVLVYMVFAAIAFRSDTMYQFTLYISNLFGMSGSGFRSGFALLLIQNNWLPIALGIVCGFPVGAHLRRYGETHRNVLSVAISAAYLLVMIATVALVVLSLSGTSYDPYQSIFSYLWSK